MKSFKSSFGFVWVLTSFCVFATTDGYCGKKSRATVTAPSLTSPETTTEVKVKIRKKSRKGPIESVNALSSLGKIAEERAGMQSNPNHGRDSEIRSALLQMGLIEKNKKRRDLAFKNNEYASPVECSSQISSPQKSPERNGSGSHTPTEVEEEHPASFESSRGQ
jgi:hypothetical protein